MAAISFWLYGKPGWELDEGSQPTETSCFREVGDKIKRLMDRKADLGDKLLADGWELNVRLYDIQCFKDGLKTEDVKEHLDRLGITQQEYNLDDLESDDDEEV